MSPAEVQWSRGRAVRSPSRLGLQPPPSLLFLLSGRWGCWEPLPALPSKLGAHHPRATHTQLAFTNPQPLLHFIFSHNINSLTAPLCNRGSMKERRREKDGRTQGWRDEEGAEAAGSTQRGQGAIACPGTIDPLPAEPAHLDPAGLRSHLVHPPPPVLNANPFCRGAPHVGASCSHVSAPPPAQVPRSAWPLPGTQTGRGRSAARGGGLPPPPPQMPGPGKAFGKGEPRGSSEATRRDRGSWVGGRKAPLRAEPPLPRAPRLAGQGGLPVPRPPCG